MDVAGGGLIGARKWIRRGRSRREKRGKEEEKERKEKKGKKKERRKEREEKSFRFVRVFKTRFYTSLSFPKQNFVFVYFNPCFRY